MWMSAACPWRPTDPPHHAATCSLHAGAAKGAPHTQPAAVSQVSAALNADLAHNSFHLLRSSKQAINFHMASRGSALQESVLSFASALQAIIVQLRMHQCSMQHGSAGNCICLRLQGVVAGAHEQAHVRSVTFNVAFPSPTLLPQSSVAFLLQACPGAGGVRRGGAAVL